MARRSSTIVILLALAGTAMAQTKPGVESVTVTGTKSRAVMDQYIQNFAAPTRIAGKLARWREGVCPQVVGLKAEYTAFIEKRVRDVAQQVGAPVGAEGCRTNIQVVFTTAPQTLLDDVRQHQPEYLGYADTATAREKLAIVTRPLQAWYSTATRDLNGNIEVDGRKTLGITMDWPPVQPGGDMHVSGGPPMELSQARVTKVTGGRLRDGVTSELNHVTIVAEPDKLLDHEIGELADYVAMLSLTQIVSLDVCQPLPSIVNMLAKDCEHPAIALTDNDLAYLRGLYKMSPDVSARTQAGQIAYQMQQSLNGK